MEQEIKLIMTCSACPEQYDAVYKGKVVGYLRLRHGSFRVEYQGETVYQAFPDGDGCFLSEERDKYLRKAKKAIRKELKKVKFI